MIHTFPFTFIALIVFTFITNASSEGLQIADQQAFIGKLYYFRLPLTRTELKDIVDVKVTETDTESNLEKWFLVLKSVDKIEFIGLPGIEEKKLHFFHLRITKKDGAKLDDVFVLDVIEKPILPLTKASDVQKDCIIQVIPTFANIGSVWKVIRYLMPAKLRQETDLETQFQHFRQLSDTDDANSLIQQWSQLLLSVTFTVEPNNVRYFKITIEQQQCNKNEKPAEDDDLEYKLKKLGVEYNLVKIVKSVNLPEDSYEDDDFKNQLLSTKLWSHVSLHSNAAKVHNHYRRHVFDKLHSTPALFPEWVTAVESGRPSRDEEDARSESLETIMTRVVPRLTSPTLMAPQSSQLYSSEVNEHSPHIVYSHRKFHTTYIMSTPVLSPDLPTDHYDDLLTPTPSLSLVTTVSLEPPTSEVAATDLRHGDLSQNFVISPSKTLPFISTTVSFGPSMTSSDLLTSASMTPSTTISESSFEETSIRSTTPLTTLRTPVPTYPNKGPAIHKVIPKLNLTSGRYWRYHIPSDAFLDSEDGNTRKLNLTFLIVDQNASQEDYPPPDYWIQFDRTNQYLFALPTDKHIGKHKFTLVAMDSKGKSVTEYLEVHVRQHSSFRAFHHLFTLYHVKWDSYKYPLLIEAVSKLARKVVRVFGDNNLTSFTVQSIENAESSFTVSWTNSSLPAYPCPKEIIHNLYGKIADLMKPTKGISANPSRYLLKVTSPEFEIQGVGLRLLSSCSVSTPTDASVKTVPSLRNAIDELKFKFGDVFRYKIPEDMFDGNIRQLDMSLLTIDGHIPSRDGFISFDAEKQEIYGLALSPNEVYSNEFQIVARDTVTGVESSDAFVVNFEEDFRERSFEISVSVALINEAEMDIGTKALLARKISSSLLTDSDASYVRVLDIKKHPYDLNNKRKRRNERSNSLYFNNSKFTYDEFGESSSGRFHQRLKRHNKHFYEFTWTNVSNAMTSDNTCPTDNILNDIVHPIFGVSSTKSISSLKEKFEPDFNLIHIGFKPVGNCSEVLPEREVGTKPHITLLATVDPNTDSVDENSEIEPTQVTEAPVGDEFPEEYMKTVIPVLIAIVIMFLITCVIIIILIRYRRRQEKSRFDVNGVHSSEYSNESEAFLQKGGRVPVILESEQFLNHQRINSPVIMPPQDQRKLHELQQMSPDRQPLTKSYETSQTPRLSQNRIQPPPYR